MNWQFWKRKQAEIPNPRDKKRRQDAYEQAQRNVLQVTQFFCFVLAYLILMAVTQ